MENLGNLDIELTLSDSAGNQIAVSSPASSTSATFATTVPGGSYFLKVAGVGAGTPTANPPSGYTSYGSLGQYTLSGSVPFFGPPLITSATTATIGVGNVFSYAITAAGAPTSFAATGLPAGVCAQF